MYQHLKNYKKPILAFFGVFLMISFLLTGYVGTDHQGDPEVGTIAGEKVHLSALRSAANEWSFLTEGLFGLDPQSGQPIPLAVATLGRDTAVQIRQHPEMYFLLLDEARRAGTSVSRDAIETRLRNEGIYVVQPNGAPVEFNKLTDPRLADQVRSAVTNVMTIRAQYERAASVVKVSAPLRDRALAEQFQEIKLNVTELSAESFEAQVPAPTTQQLQNHFDRFADADPDGAPSAANPLGLGYRYPNRVKVQYLTLPATELRRVVFASRPADRWEVEAIRYYNKNQSLFPTTSPTSQPAEVLKDEFSLGGAKAKSTGPTTRPFAEVREAAIDAVLKPEVDRLGEQVTRRVRAIFLTDDQAFTAAGGATTLPVGVAAPTTRPLSSMGVAYDGFEYLQKVALTVQKEFGILPTVTSVADSWLSATELTALPNIGSARNSDGTFVTMALQDVIDFLPESQKNYPTTLRLLQPSPVLKDALDNAYIFRVTATRVAGRPAGVSEVADKIAKDWRTQQSYDAARAAGIKGVDLAKAKDLSAAAAELKLKVSTTSFFRNQQYGPPIEGIALAPMDRATFVNGAFQLLQIQTDPDPSTNRQPVTTIELPEGRKVVVAELVDVQRVKQFDERPEAYWAARMTMQFQQMLGQSVQAGWFNYESVKARTGYQPREEQDKPKAASAS